MESITLPSNLIGMINVFLIGLALVLALIGYIRGFVSQTVDLLFIGIGLLVALFLAPIMAKSVPLLPKSINFNQIPFVGGSVEFVLEKIIWTVIVTLLVWIIGLFIKPYFIKKVLKYRKKVLIDRIGGAVFGMVPVALIGFVIALILNVPVFTNGTEVLGSTVLSPYRMTSASVVANYIDDNPTLNLYVKIQNGEALNETDLSIIKDVLLTMGFPANVTAVAMKFVKQEEITISDIEVLKKYAESQNLTKTDVKGWLQKLGFSALKIQELMDKYGN